MASMANSLFRGKIRDQLISQSKDPRQISDEFTSSSWNFLGPVLDVTKAGDKLRRNSTKDDRSLFRKALRPAHTGGLTGPLKSYHDGTGHRDLSHEQFTQSVLRNKSEGFVLIIKISLNSPD